MSSVILLQFAQCLTNENILYHSYTPPGNVCGSVLKTEIFIDSKDYLVI